jgi:hypothetical protein
VLAKLPTQRLSRGATRGGASYEAHMVMVASQSLQPRQGHNLNSSNLM